MYTIDPCAPTVVCHESECAYCQVFDVSSRFLINAGRYNLEQLLLRWNDSEVHRKGYESLLNCLMVQMLGPVFW